MDQVNQICNQIMVLKIKLMKKEEEEDQAEYRKAEKTEQQKAKEINEKKAMLVKQKARKDQINAEINQLTEQVRKGKQQLRMFEQTNTVLETQEMNAIHEQLERDR